MKPEQPESARRPPDGFTLVELLVVIVILGVLASIVVFAVGGITNHSQDSAAKADARSLEIAEEHLLAEGFSSGSGPLYGTEADLVGAGMVHGVSTLNDICLRTDSKDYFVAPAGDDCTPVPSGHSGTYTNAAP